MIYLNNKLVETKQFPNGETLIDSNRLNILKNNSIILKFENDMDLMNLMFLTKHLDNTSVKSELVILYMPYSRMDRTEGQTVFTLKYVCDLINNLNFDRVVISEPHSDVCVALLNRVKVFNTSSYIAEKLMKDLNFGENDYLFYPDGGALKRYSKQIKYDRILTANKERDFSTGRIKKLTIEGTVPTLNSFRVVIVDDLCSKGGTFMLSAEKLKELGATDIYLVVTHCEDTIFEGELLTTDLIKKIYTTDSILTKSHEKIQVVKGLI
ncbi:ribose-phosphate pyrophosphokinase [Clostridium tagluense]|uniref:Ribose-phosphate pyrophosphokinase n=1 Tax=Clostridium tagluense TaxID=360422 RepID=A0A401UQ91_9CLOT|nr:ribose-phosphate pyrophosphokinase [Clostridium tagluense]GCD11694.1 ribose-phosphate pyrophosphokinase [Clostridium tagluense]